MDQPADPSLMSTPESGEDRQNYSHRPLSFEQFIGQENVIGNLKVMIEAARIRSEPIEHLLFSGPPGLGKTTLAHLIATELETQLIASSGPLLDKPGELVAIISNLSEGQVLFIDEVHRMPRGVEETLYSAMEDFRVDIVVGTGPGARTISMALERFTLIGATTRSGLLSAPLRDRFGVMFQMEFYKPEELAQIITRGAKLEAIAITADGAMHLAQHSRGTPRIALRLMRRVRDFAQVAGEREITLSSCMTALKKMGISELGLDKMDRNILSTIIEKFEGGPVGIETLAAVFHEEKDVLAEVHEPYLLKLGMLHKTPRGRIATKAAYEYIGVVWPDDRDRAPLFDE